MAPIDHGNTGVSGAPQHCSGSYIRILDLGTVITHFATAIPNADGLQIHTSASLWAYAVSLPLRLPERRNDDETLTVWVTLAVDVGRVGVGIVNEAQDAFLMERFVEPTAGDATIELSIHERVIPGPLVFRNGDARNEPSQFTLRGVGVAWRKRHEWPFG
jgi:hypothetical protein